MTSIIMNDERFELLMAEFKTFKDKEINFYNEDSSWEVKESYGAESIPEKDNAYTVTSTVAMSKRFGKMVVKRNLVFTGDFYLDQEQIKGLKKAVVTVEVKE